MLVTLQIENVALVEKLVIDFKSGLTAITGETGAGKSIMLNAMKMLLGARSDLKMLRPGSKRMLVAAEFDISRHPSAKQLLRNWELGEDDALFIRRIVSDSGRNQCFINDQLTSVNALKELSQHIMELHGQHQFHNLLQQQFQGQLLDAYANNSKLLDELHNIVKNWQSIKKQLEQLLANNQDDAHIALLKYQLDELQELALEEDELEELHEQHKRLSQAQDLLTEGSELISLLDNGDASVSNQLDHASQRLNHLAVEHSELKAVADCIEQASVLVHEGMQDINHFYQSVELNPEKLNDIEQRLSHIHSIARKHKVEPEALFELQAKISNELSGYENLDTKQAELQSTLTKYLAEYNVIAKKLSAARNKAAKKLSKEVTELLHELAMPNAEFRVALETRKNAEPNKSGAEDIYFEICTNPGQGFQLLAKIASGGELSRTSLAIQVKTAQVNITPAIIFDEVDVGISGGTAEIVGRLLKQLAANMQVICVTHLPQVAVQAQQHLRVRKYTEAGQSFSDVRQLGAEEKVQEIARLLGGVKITKQTLAHAEEMLELGEA